MTIFSKVSGPSCHPGGRPETYNPDPTERHLLPSTQSSLARGVDYNTTLGFPENPWAVTTGSKQFGFQNLITESESTAASTPKWDGAAQGQAGGFKGHVRKGSCLGVPVAEGGGRARHLPLPALGSSPFPCWAPCPHL